MNDQTTNGSPQDEAPVTKQELVPKLPDKDAQNWGIICHLSALPGIWLPFGMIIGPLLFWVLKKDEHAFVDHHGKEAINFQLSMSIYMIISAVLVLIAVGLFFVVVLFIADIVLTVIAAVEAGKGKMYRYPFTIRFFQ